VRRSIRVVLFMAIAIPAASRPGGAQPAEPPPAAEANPAPAPRIDEARIRELVDREVARILTDRATKEAADRAARETEKEPVTEDSDVKGASGFMDTRIAFTLTNENMLAGPGETVPSVPGWRFGTPSSLGVLFFDGYDTRYSGFETLSHATLYREYTSGHLEAEGALVVRIDDLSETSLRLSDDGSYLTISDWKDPSHKDPTRISLTAFPVSSDRFRLGYSYRLSWGGSPEYRRAVSSVPGIKLQYDGPSMYAFVGAKSAVITDPRDTRQKAALAALGGFGFDPSSMLRLEVNGGYFDRGPNELPDVLGKKIQLFGASVQASLHRGMPLRSSLDYRLYKFHGESVSGLFAPERYPGGLAWLVQSELTVLGQTLKDPAGPGATVRQIGKAGDLNVRVKLDRIRMRLDLSYRDLAFLLHSEPSLPNFQDFPSGYRTTADVFAAIGVDHNWGDWLTIGLIAGIEKPATLTAPRGVAVVPGAGTDPMATSTAVIRSNNVDTLISVLPPGQSGVAQLAIQGTVRFDFSRVFSTLVELFYSHDGNQTEVHRNCTDPDTCAITYGPGKFHQLGLNATLQARF
jgi:hypothetical protein